MESYLLAIHMERNLIRHSLCRLRFYVETGDLNGGVGSLIHFDHQLDCGSHVVINSHIYKFWYATDLNPIEFKVSCGQNKGFDCLVDRTRTNGLYLRSVMFANNTRNGAGNTGCSRSARYFD